MVNASATNVHERCHLCGDNRLRRMVHLPDMPIAHHLRHNVSEKEARYPLTTVCCEGCGLLQISDEIPADVLYGRADSYLTGFQKPRHLDDLILTVLARNDPGSAIDVGCNDGALLAKLADYGYDRLVGIEPNPWASKKAAADGHKVYSGFLNLDLATRIAAAEGKFDTAFLRHVVEHVTDLDGFFSALKTLISDDGLIVVELPHVEEGMLAGNPSILWEEHVNYFTEPQAIFLLARYGFKMLDRRTYAFGGGSLAFIAQRIPASAAEIEQPIPGPNLRLAEKFTEKLGLYCDSLRALVQEAKDAGFTISVYGAAPRSCTILNACELGAEIDLVIDDREAIQGRLMPGTVQPIRPFAEALDHMGHRMLCLLGVGAENEFKIRRRIGDAHEATSQFVSLFPPRDSMASINAARQAIHRVRSKRDP